MAAHDYYGAPYCGGLQPKSGKGAGPDLGAGMRNQKVWFWSAWGKKGTDIYLSSRWDNRYQIYDLYRTPKNVKNWWESKTYDWVFVQELPYDLRLEDFVWAESVNPTLKNLKKQRWLQMVRHMRGKKRGL